ncbi:uncharacterized protein N7525_010991 [Penicillium rubens]|uniref:uncharacterized protein n=1 Tax=Penicillium rubens TaxID=1108849 RepID=UPI002A59D99B|nr:uncharacterized protein N7525_010991 [Penicillium rubens]KAJ5821707.1 hypothetical protein N7525_010991 [Penicillium rubens]KAJ5859355.1 hypothetical protein N7534_004632 [Penicillium rubens]
MDAFDLALKVGTGAQAPDIQLLAKPILVGARGCAGRRHPLEGLPVEEGWDKEGQEEQYTVEDGLEHSPQLKPWGEPGGSPRKGTRVKEVKPTAQLPSQVVRKDNARGWVFELWLWTASFEDGT